MPDNFSVINKTKCKLPSLHLVAVKNDILSRDYSLSIAFIGPKLSQEFNKKYRGINKPTNILSFPLSKTGGEIIICPAVVKTQTKKFDRTFREFLGFLVIHGMLHLKGMRHSSRMEALEQKYDQKYFYRNRRGVLYDKSCSGRVSKRRKKS